MIIRKATAEDIPHLIELWQQAFGDAVEDIELFFKTAFKCEWTWVAAAISLKGQMTSATNLQTKSSAKLSEETPEGVAKPVSALYMLPCQIDGKQGYYLYALATDLAYRGRGLMASLIGKAFEQAKTEEKSFVWLQPAEESLFSYYERNGFECRIPRGMQGKVNLSFSHEGKRYIEAEELTTEDFDQMPDQVLCHVFDESMLSCLIGAYPL
ncbi:MAG: GNAT family N-acetyltransferase [Lachnospiraceae bacterium]|nr:GNAT family N-acetyltransferase [Candidatus Equihabitans merdae]